MSIKNEKYIIYLSHYVCILITAMERIFAKLINSVSDDTNCNNSTTFYYQIFFTYFISNYVLLVLFMKKNNDIIEIANQRYDKINLTKELKNLYYHNYKLIFSSINGPIEFSNIGGIINVSYYTHTTINFSIIFDNAHTIVDNIFNFTIIFDNAHTFVDKFIEVLIFLNLTILKIKFILIYDVIHIKK